MNSRPLKVFLTGATGFVGSHLARLLAREGCEVHALTRPGHSLEHIRDIEPQLRRIEGDLKDFHSWKKQIAAIQPDVCFHLAWITTPGVYLKSPENMELFQAGVKLAEVLLSAGCKKMVAVGTCFEYDTHHQPLSEQTPTRPKTVYSETKLRLLMKLQELLSGQSMQLLWPRLFYLYGPGENERRLVPAIIRSLLTGASVKLTSVDKVRDYLHVEDVVSAIWKVSNSDIQGPVNIASGQPVTLRDMVYQVSGILGKSNSVKFEMLPDDPMDPKQVVGDNRLLLKTGWNPKYTLESGLRQTIDWWKAR